MLISLKVDGLQFGHKLATGEIFGHKLATGEICGQELVTQAKLVCSWSQKIQLVRNWSQGVFLGYDQLYDQLFYCSVPGVLESNRMTLQ